MIGYVRRLDTVLSDYFGDISGSGVVPIEYFTLGVRFNLCLSSFGFGVIQ